MRRIAIEKLSTKSSNERHVIRLLHITAMGSRLANTLLEAAAENPDISQITLAIDNLLIIINFPVLPGSHVCLRNRENEESAAPE